MWNGVCQWQAVYLLFLLGLWSSPDWNECSQRTKFAKHLFPILSHILPLHSLDKGFQYHSTWCICGCIPISNFLQRSPEYRQKKDKSRLRKYCWAPTSLWKVMKSWFLHPFGKSWNHDFYIHPSQVSCACTRLAKNWVRPLFTKLEKLDWTNPGFRFVRTYIYAEPCMCRMRISGSYIRIWKCCIVAAFHAGTHIRITFSVLSLILRNFTLV